RVLPVVATDEIDSYKEHDPRQFIVACEKYGVPQQRHRVILVGIREDLGDVELPPLVAKAAPTVNSVIHLLPRLRSGLSRTRKGDKYVRLVDDADSWLKSIQDQIGLKDSMNSPRWLVNLDDEIRERIVGSISGNKQPPQSRGSSFIRKSKTLNESHPLYDHFIDERLPGVCNHETRSHLDRDLVRYLFAAAYSKHHGISPRLHQFPSALLPNHKNATSGNFNDRFRVQLGDQPSTTITSHISKDGHYFIHPDPTQCRSLTVREAARLQTLRIVI
ncbi:MAG: DNA cytosine methyltransferase, partial [Planctomycetaceae bacterium]|nr:DNA cytosine methyltransferase [Planctomycetaceae bacterium]